MMTTSRAESKIVISILHPQVGPAILAGSPMRLWAAVTSDTFKPVEPNACIWTMDGKEVGRGGDIWIVAPEEGEHNCTLIVADRGGRSEVSSLFTTISPQIQRNSSSIKTP